VTCLSMSDLRDLALIETGRCVSIYMPTHPQGREGQQDAVRLKNLTTAAETQLIARGMRSVEAREFIKPLTNLIDDAPAWGHRKLGLASFLSVDSFTNYWLSTPVEEAVTVGRRFFLKRLLPAVSECPRFYVLVISRNRPRLLKVGWEGAENLHPKNFPVSFTTALNLQTADRGEQVHSAMRGDFGKEAGVFHGQGGHRDTLKEELAIYVRMIDEATTPVIRRNTWPLILAGVDYELAAYRAASECDNIVDEALCGNFDYVEDHELVERGLPIAREFYDSERCSALSRYNELAATGLASNDIEAVVPAAHQGRIQSLFVDIGAAEFGRYCPGTASVEKLESKADPEFDLVEEAVTHTLRHNGEVYVATPRELPVDSALCAIFRYC
jgi:hypothetical protein